MIMDKMKQLFCENQNHEKKEITLIWLLKALIHSAMIICFYSWLSKNKIYYDSLNIYEHYIKSALPFQVREGICECKIIVSFWKWPILEVVFE